MPSSVTLSESDIVVTEDKLPQDIAAFARDRIVATAEAAQAENDAHWETGQAKRERANRIRLQANRLAANMAEARVVTPENRNELAALERLADKLDAEASAHTSKARPKVVFDPKKYIRFLSMVRRPMVKDHVDIPKRFGSMNETALASVLSERAECLEGIKALNASMVPADEAKTRVRKAIEAKISASSHKVNLLPATRLQPDEDGTLTEGEPLIEDLTALLLQAARPSILAMCESRIDALYRRSEFEDVVIMSARERTKETKALREKLAELERIEGRILLALHAAGKPVSLRPDTDLVNFFNLVPASSAAEPKRSNVIDVHKPTNGKKKATRAA